MAEQRILLFGGPKSASQRGMGSFSIRPTHVTMISHGQEVTMRLEMWNMGEDSNLAIRSNSKLSLRQIGVVLTLGLAARLLVLWALFRHLSVGWFFQHGTEMALLAQSVLQGK